MTKKEKLFNVKCLVCGDMGLKNSGMDSEDCSFTLRMCAKEHPKVMSIIKVDKEKPKNTCEHGLKHCHFCQIDWSKKK